MDEIDVIETINEEVSLLGEEQQSESSVVLPDGKLFHLFVSHSAEDSEETWTMITDMEKRFGIKCMYADRDFQPGKDITDNIKDGIERSIKTVLVLTPSYLDSGYCWFEQKVAFQMSITKRQNCLIPVILKQIEGPLPASLSNLTYIDASKEPDVPARIHEALMKTDDSPALSFYNDTENETFESVQKAKQQNGATVLEVFPEPYYPQCSGSGWEFKALTPIQANQLTSLEINIGEEYENLRTRLNKQRFLRYFALRNSKSRCCLSGCLTIMVLTCVFNAILFIMYLAEKMDFFTTITIAWVLYYGPPFVVIMPLCCCVFRCVYRKKMFKNGAALCWKHTRSFYRVKKCLLLYDITSNLPRIVFIRYDVEKCRQYLQRFYETRIPGLPEQEYRDCADDAMDTFLERNGQRLIDWKHLPTSFMNRHYTFRQKACLCQLVLDEIII